MIILKRLFYLPLYVLHLVLYIFSAKRVIISRDALRYYPNKSEINKWDIMDLLIRNKVFRNVFYLRIGKAQRFLRYFLPPLESMDLGSLPSMNVGEGFYILHGVGIVISQYATIGWNCTILQNATIGDRSGKGAPTIGNNVLIGAGAIILGGVKIGDNAKIGAGAIVVDDVPENATVISRKSDILLPS